MRGGSSLASPVALLLVILICAALFGWIIYSQEGAITETVEVGSEGIKKAMEVKLQLEESSQETP